MKYQAILFDMDGTLLDTLTDMQAAANRPKFFMMLPPMV